jgi:glutaredoxin-like YruB-family protein
MPKKIYTARCLQDGYRREAAMHAPLKIYTLPTCPHCREVKQYLEQHGVHYQEIDVHNNEKATQEVMSLSGGTRVPVIVIGNKVIVGFNKTEIDTSLEL